jgi:hypothetical protein
MVRHRRAQVTGSRRAGGVRSTSVGWVAIASLALAGAGAAPAGAPAAPLAPAGCPALPPTPAGGGPGVGPVLSGSLAAMRLCRYGPLPARRLEGQVVTRSHPLIASIYKGLNALLPVPAGPTMCPADIGSEILIRARYRSGKTATVTVALSGCRTVTRGRVERSAEISPGGAALLARLERLTP